MSANPNHMQPPPNPPHNRSDLEGLRAIEDMNRSIQGLSRSFQGFADAARALLLGGTTWNSPTNPAETTIPTPLNEPFGGTQRKDQQPHTTKAPTGTGSLPHLQAVSSQASIKAAKRRRKKLRVQQLKQSNQEAFVKAESLTRLSPYTINDIQDNQLSTNNVAKVEDDGTIHPDAQFIHPSRRPQVTTRPIIGRSDESPIPDQAGLSSQDVPHLSRDKAHQERAPLPSIGAVPATSCAVQIKGESSPHLALHKSPPIESNMGRPEGLHLTPALESHHTGCDENAAKTQDEFQLGCMPRKENEETTTASRTFSNGDNIMTDGAKRGCNIDEEGVPVSKKAKFTAGPYLNEIARMQSDYDLRQPPYRLTNTDEHFDVMLWQAWR
ncbi:MAG: hypothetical protein Q9199_004587 [Rusavskia elegans]